MAAAAAISPKAPTRAAASPSRAWARTSPICRTRRCTGSSAASFRIATIRPSPSTPISRSRSYLRHQGITFVERFDANSYLYLTRAMDYFDLAARLRRRAGQGLHGHADALLRDLVHQRLAVPDRPRSRAIVHALNAGGARVSFAEIVTDKGHDAFLLDEPELFAIVRGFLDGAGKARGLSSKELMR